MSRPTPTIRNKGVTLIELMVGLAIISITLAFGLPSYAEWMRNTRIRNTAESILSGLQLARSTAVSRNTPVRLNLSGDGGWDVCLGSTDACVTQIQRRSASEGSSSDVTVDPALIAFNGLGTATVGAPANINVTMPSASTSRSLRIVVNAGGTIRMCDPAVVDTSDSRSC